MKINNVKYPKLFLNLIDACNKSIFNLKTQGQESNFLSDLISINFRLVLFILVSINNRTAELLLADLVFYISREIDMLLEVDYFGTLVQGAPIQGQFVEFCALFTKQSYTTMEPTVKNQTIQEFLNHLFQKNFLSRIKTSAN